MGYRNEYAYKNAVSIYYLARSIWSKFNSCKRTDSRVINLDNVLKTIMEHTKKALSYNEYRYVEDKALHVTETIIDPTLLNELFVGLQLFDIESDIKRLNELIGLFNQNVPTGEPFEWDGTEFGGQYYCY